MMPVLPSPRRPNLFSIDSLMSKECSSAGRTAASTPCSCPSVQDTFTVSNSSMVPPMTGIQHTSPPHPAFLSGANSVYSDGLQARLDSHSQLLGSVARSAMGSSLPAGLAGVTGHHPGLPHTMFPQQILGVPPKDSFPIYSWLLSRHGGYLSHRLTGAEAAYLFPFRKPKRIRTAFSPSQLLQLEHAFERNHYVVGQERKDLASCLNLTETQVKVWFQNRRTKHKRTQQEEVEQKRCDRKLDRESDYVDILEEDDSPLSSPNPSLTSHDAMAQIDSIPSASNLTRD